MNKFVSTKEKILYSLKKTKEHESTMKDIMEHFSISETAVRKHLQELISNGFVAERIVKQEIGRPFHLYSLTGKGHSIFPSQHEQLPIDLLNDLEEVGGKQVVNELLLKRREREEKELFSALAHEDFVGKIKKLTKLQNEKGYMMEFRETPEGNYEIVNYNCPIYNLASSYGQVCKNENGMIKKIFSEADVVSTSCIVTGGKYCGWLLSKQQEKVKETV